MTDLEYLEDTYLFNGNAKIINFGENNFGKYIILNKTIFYPQGGGQPTDLGEIIIGDEIISINNVRINVEGVIFHYIKKDNNISSIIKNGEDVILKIEKENRLINSKNHTAGHLIDIAIRNIGLNLLSTKGFHFKKGSYVEYSGNIEGLNEGNNKIMIIEKIEKELNKLISQNLRIIIEPGKTNIDNPNSPEGKSFRFVYIEGYKNLGCGCGGTHVKSTSEIGNIKLEKLDERSES